MIGAKSATEDQRLEVARSGDPDGQVGSLPADLVASVRVVHRRATPSETSAGLSGGPAAEFSIRVLGLGWLRLPRASRLPRSGMGVVEYPKPAKLKPAVPYAFGAAGRSPLRSCWRTAITLPRTRTMTSTPMKLRSVRFRTRSRTVFALISSKVDLIAQGVMALRYLSTSTSNSAGVRRSNECFSIAPAPVTTLEKDALIAFRASRSPSGRA